jgi:ankyrin repeat protein
LLLAARNGYANIASLLLQHHANPAIRNKLQWGILTYAVHAPNQHCLLELDAFLDHDHLWREKPLIDVSLRSSRVGFVPNHVIRCTGYTPIHVCVAVRNPPVLRLAAQKGPNRDVHQPCAEGYTPLHLAAAVDAGRIAL